MSEGHRGSVRHAVMGHKCRLPAYNNHFAHLMSNRLAVTYSQTGVRGVFRSLIRGLTNLRENIWSWRVPTPGTWVRVLTPLVPMLPCPQGSQQLLSWTVWFATVPTPL